jgi:hypothetical protein
MEGRGEDGGDFFRIETRNEFLFDGWLVGAGIRGRGTEVRDAGADAEFGFREVRGQFAEVLHFEASQFVLGRGKSNLFIGFAPCRVPWRLFQSV